MSSEFLEEDPLHEDPSESDVESDSPYHASAGGEMRRRRSSVFGSVADMGGVNSIRSFSRSWCRAAGFAEVVPHRPSFVLLPDEPSAEQQQQQQQLAGQSNRESPYPAHATADSAISPGTSPVRTQSQQGPEDEGVDSIDSYDGVDPAAGPIPGSVEQPQQQHQYQQQIDFRERERKLLDAELGRSVLSTSPSRTSFFAAAPPLATSAHLATSPLAGSFSSLRSYGTAAAGSPPRARPEIRWDLAAPGDDCERPPILVREVEQDGKLVLAVKGQSTLPQTVFNSINALIGVGILSLPLALKYSGWVCGLITLSTCAAVTAHTSRLLARCMELDPSLITFSDLAYACFGHRARVATAVVFTAELVAVNVALVVLFADSLGMLFPELLSVDMWKLVCSAILLPLNVLPLRLLSFTSVVGILSTFLVVVIVVISGLQKQQQPGSLTSPAVTHLFPENWSTIPLAYGLFLSPFSSHAVLPQIYRDMRHPTKFTKSVGITFSFTYLVDLTMAIVGILMFGDAVREEITSSIIETDGYPKALAFAMSLFVAVIPLTKVPLNSRPLISSAELLLGVYAGPAESGGGGGGGGGPLRVAAVKLCIRVGIVLVFFVIAVLFPSFDSILSLMGSLFCATISVILPFSFYLKLFGGQIGRAERIMSYLAVAVFTTLSIVGTVFALLPKSAVGISS